MTSRIIILKNCIFKFPALNKDKNLIPKTQLSNMMEVNLDPTNIIKEKQQIAHPQEEAIGVNRCLA